MATKSILELEEARRRLQQMTDDHRQFAELVFKLRSMRDALTKTLDDTNARLREAEERAGRAQDLLDTTTRQLEDFRKESEATLADVFSTGTKVEARLKKLVDDTRGAVQTLTGQVAAARSEMEKQFVASNEAQERRFASFQERHEAALRVVQEAYDRARATLESHSPLFDRLDTKVDKLIESQAESGAALRHELEEGRAAVSRKHDELVARFQAEITSATKTLAEQTASECQRITKVQTEHERLLGVLRKRVRYGRLLLWFVLLGAGAVLATLLYHQREEVFRFWASVVHSIW